MSFKTWGTTAVASSLLTGLLVGSTATGPASAAAVAPSDCDAFEVIAHRGDDTSGIDQNTVAAFDAAHRGGYSIEGDVWVDADRVLWMFHDLNTLKATGTEGKINQMSTAQVEALRYRKAGSPLLRLEDALTAFQSYPGTRVYLEPKTSYLADDVADAVVARNLTATTWITDHIDKARAAQPAVQVVAKVAGTLPKRPGTFIRDGVGVVAAQSGRLVPTTVARYQRRGVEVQGKNVKSTGAWRRAIQAGADAQLTDRPAGLRTFCPVALKKPQIAARRSGRTGPRTMVVRGKYFYDVANLRVADRTVPYEVISPRRINVRIKGISKKRVSVYVRNPNGPVERTVRLGRR